MRGSRHSVRCASMGALATAALLAGACSRSTGATGSGAPNAVTESVTASGTVYVSGSEGAPMLALQRDAGGSLWLEGELVAELRRLSGAQVEIRGTRTSAPTDPHERLAVGEYTVLGIDGQRPRVGLLTASGGVVRLVGPDGLADSDGLALADPDSRLAALTGAKVWVVVDTSGSPARVLSYGVLREPPR